MQQPRGFRALWHADFCPKPMGEFSHSIKVLLICNLMATLIC